MTLRRRFVLAVSRGRGILRPIRSVLARLGVPLVAEELADLSDSGVRRYYGSRLTDAGFLLDPTHYERPRADWILRQITGGSVLELGCGNGGMTALISPLASIVLAVDVSEMSVEACRARALHNVQTKVELIESLNVDNAFDYIVMSEVIEHVRDPLAVVRRCLEWLAPGGKVLVTTPLGYWPSIEHLNQFTLAEWQKLMMATGASDWSAEVINDKMGRARWLGAALSNSTK